jgi:hypothetical protein
MIRCWPEKRLPGWVGDVSPTGKPDVCSADGSDGSPGVVEVSKRKDDV